jgi:DNA mismatch endonuclease (patch repair protein)
MADVLTPEQRSFNMSRIRGRGNASTELAMVRALRAAKITGWRRHAELPGHPDFVFPRTRLAVFVHGCFWHGCPACYRKPGTNKRYWSGKVATNRRRDARVARQLRAEGWSVMTVWEHSVQQRPETVAARLRRLAPDLP